MLEIMSTVMILSILATLSFVGLSKALGHQRLMGDSNTTAAALKYIGGEARVGKKTVSVQVNLDNDFIIGWMDDDEDGVPDSLEEVIKRFDTSTGVDIRAGKIGTYNINGSGVFTFLDDGSSSKQVVFVLKSDSTEEEKTIFVNSSSGWVEVFKGAPTGL
jgi:Tfp pilus assembly protein FimT